MCYVIKLYVQDMKKQLNNKVGPEYNFSGWRIEAQAKISLTGLE
jgi:hypothetical protein